jgi:hypothetical protein
MRALVPWLIGIALLAAAPSIGSADLAPGGDAAEGTPAPPPAPPDTVEASAMVDTLDAPVAAPPPPLPPPEVRFWQMGLFRADRLHHASFALTSGAGVGLMVGEPVAAFASAMGLGLIKEVWDIRGSGFDFLDLVADALGAGAATAVTSSLLR